MRAQADRHAQVVEHARDRLVAGAFGGVGQPDAPAADIQARLAHNEPGLEQTLGVEYVVVLFGVGLCHPAGRRDPHLELQRRRPPRVQPFDLQLSLDADHRVVARQGHHHEQFRQLFVLTLGQQAAHSFGYASLGLSLEQYGINAVTTNVPGSVFPTAAEKSEPMRAKRPDPI